MVRPGSTDKSTVSPLVAGRRRDATRAPRRWRVAPCRVFYRARAAITRRLIERHGFTIVAVEADWPDAARAAGASRTRHRLLAHRLAPHRRSATRRYDASDQELGGRHVSVLRGSRQHCLKHRFDALRRERVEAHPSRFGECDGLILRASPSAVRNRDVGLGGWGVSHVRTDLDTRIKYDLATNGASPS